MLSQLLDFLCNAVAQIPLECFQYRFMQEALLGILIAAPLAAAAGVHVINFRMAFFSDAIGHSVFAGAALGVLLGAIGPAWMMPMVALVIGLGVTALERNTRLASDTVIGVFFSFIAALGLMLVSCNPALSKQSQIFLYGDILTVGPAQIAMLAVLAAASIVFEILSFNRLIAISVHEPLARVHRIPTAFYQYVHAALLALIVIGCVRATGVLLVSALLIVPAAAARNLVRSAGGMFRAAILLGLISGVTGLVISAQDWANTAAGATIVMTACVIFTLSLAIRALRRTFRR